MTTHALSLDESGNLRVGRVSAFSTKRGFVTVRLDDKLDMDAVVARWDENADLLKYGPRTLMHGLLDEIMDRYFDTIESLDDRIEQIEDILFSEDAKAAHEVSRTTFRLRHELVNVRRAILPMREVINTLMRRATIDDQAPELVPYYEDLYDHAIRAAEWTESLRDMITSIFETNMSLSDTRMNSIMKQLTAWAAIIAVPTAITGFYGQNVPYPGYEHHWGFWISSASILLIAFALFVTFKKKDWL
jgi:magnesium transporter